MTENNRENSKRICFHAANVSFMLVKAYVLHAKTYAFYCRNSAFQGLLQAENNAHISLFGRKSLIYSRLCLRTFSAVFYAQMI